MQNNFKSTAKRNIIFAIKYLPDKIFSDISLFENHKETTKTLNV